MNLIESDVGNMNQQASILIAESTGNSNRELGKALERCRKTFRLEIDVADLINHSLLSEWSKAKEKEKEEKRKIRLKQHYTNAIEYIDNGSVDEDTKGTT